MVFTFLARILYLRLIWKGIVSSFPCFSRHKSWIVFAISFLHGNVFGIVLTQFEFSTLFNSIIYQWCFFFVLLWNSNINYLAEYVRGIRRRPESVLKHPISIIASDQKLILLLVAIFCSKHPLNSMRMKWLNKFTNVSPVDFMLQNVTQFSRSNLSKQWNAFSKSNRSVYTSVNLFLQLFCIYWLIGYNNNWSLRSIK